MTRTPRPPLAPELAEARALLARLDSVWPTEPPLGALDAMRDAARAILAARELVAALLADMVASPEPGNPYRLDSVVAAVAFVELAAPEAERGRGYDSGRVFRARLSAGTLGGRFKAPFLGADLEPLGRAVESLAEAERALAGTRQTLGRCRLGLRSEGARSGWTPSDLETLTARAKREAKAVKFARARWAEELDKARNAGALQ